LLEGGWVAVLPGVALLILTLLLFSAPADTPSESTDRRSLATAMWAAVSGYIGLTIASDASVTSKLSDVYFGGIIAPFSDFPMNTSPCFNCYQDMWKASPPLYGLCLITVPLAFIPLIYRLAVAYKTGRTGRTALLISVGPVVGLALIAVVTGVFVVKTHSVSDLLLKPWQGWTDLTPVILDATHVDVSTENGDRENPSYFDQIITQDRIITDHYADRRHQGDIPFSKLSLFTDYLKRSRATQVREAQLRAKRRGTTWNSDSKYELQWFVDAGVEKSQFEKVLAAAANAGVQAVYIKGNPAGKVDTMNRFRWPQSPLLKRITQKRLVSIKVLLEPESYDVCHRDIWTSAPHEPGDVHELDAHSDVLNFVKFHHCFCNRTYGSNTKEIKCESPLEDGWKDLSIDDIGKFAALERLELVRMQIEDLRPLSQLKKLKSLKLIHNGIANLNAIPQSTLLQLEEFTIFWLDVTDYAILAQMPKLKKLTVLGIKHQDISAVNQLRGLEELTLWGLELNHIPPLHNLTKLKSLDVRNTRINDISAIKGLGQMERLLLGDTGVHDLSALRDMPEIEELDLYFTAVRNIAPLKHLKKLRVLNLDTAFVKNLKPIAKHPHIEVLHLPTSTALRNFKIIAGFSKQEQLQAIHLYERAPFSIDSATPENALQQLQTLSDKIIVHQERQEYQSN
ncbi:MAG: hypothetical protein JXX14_11900, partial [Deltaproteobacteria bacterium]|nr:hypothetical protein [Deltaproteobacteria bacterium]